MPKLIYMTMASLDGFIEDRDGGFRWAEPDDEVHAFVNDLVRPIDTYLYGRRMFETMAVWETDASLAGESEITRDFAAVWQAAEKIVFSTTLRSVPTKRTRVVSRFVTDDVRLLMTAAAGDLAVGGATLAAEALGAGLVDEYHLFVAPVVVGGGKRALPDGIVASLDLLDERRFAASGVVYLRYGIRR